MAAKTAGNRPGEFGGVPGEYGNVDAGDPLPPHLEQRALYQTDGGKNVQVVPGTQSDPVISNPSHGTGGSRIL